MVRLPPPSPSWDRSVASSPPFFASSLLWLPFCSYAHEDKSPNLSTMGHRLKLTFHGSPQPALPCAPIRMTQELSNLGIDST